MTAAVAVQKVWQPPTADLAAGRCPLWWTVSSSGALAVLLVDRRYLTQSPYIKGWIGSVPTAPFGGVLVIRHPDESVERRIIRELPMHTSYIALLPDTRLLIAESRARRGPTGTWTPNASILSPEGERQAAFCIGDDIDVLLTDHGGAIWIAYGDEGIYGGHPQSAAGLAGWNEHGQVLWTPNGRLPAWPLAGHAGATENNQVWLAWYSSASKDDTFLTRVTPLTGEVTSWRSPVPSPDGLAIRGNRAVLTRRHHNMPSTELFRAELIDDSWIVTERHTVAVPGRVVMRCGQGREGFLWLRTGDVWLRIEA
ncbi:hypothetical protein Lfu02_77490 [Longispora fulva]|uniref:Uncharacterized protein n=1 Tax=Longispora fulva TaxID=619741 RepID=A0A8J7GDX5_9ACTN|nr:hypothetical protein [Longispora fulva]MBG6136135.1 hypothetical protein [Longispora fulva]GIG63377.1 hypothetical protein Lfu02_77490 [Longispora fulva]